MNYATTERLNQVAAAVGPWLADYALCCTALLAIVLAVSWRIGQPARRLAITRPTLSALLILAALCAAPGWSLLDLSAVAPDGLAPSVPQSVGDAATLEPPITTAFPVHQIESAVPRSATAPSPSEEQGVADASVVSSLGWTTWAIGLYVVGCGLAMGWQALGVALARRMIRRARPAPAQLQSLLGDDAARTRKAPRLLLSTDVHTPVALGVSQPTILLPASMLGSDEAALQAILAHEQAHISHGDLRTLLAARALTIVLWPQPLFWLLRRMIRRDQESVADASAAELTDRPSYAEQLVAFARTAAHTRTPALATSIGLWENRSKLHRRVTALLDEHASVLDACSRGWRRSWLLGLILAAAALGSVTLSPGDGASAQDSVAANAETAPTNGAPANNQVEQTAATPQSNQQEASGETATFSYFIATTPPSDGDEQDTDRASDGAPAATTGEAQPAGVDQSRLRALYRRIREQSAPNSIRGICIDQNGQLLKDVAIEVYVSRSGVANTDGDPVFETTSNERGEFAWDNVIDIDREFPDGLPEDHIDTPNSPIISILGRREGHASQFQSNRAAWIARHGEALVWTMQPAETLRGRVIDAQGKPVAGAQVTPMGIVGMPPAMPLATTNANGEFVIEVLPPYDAEVERRKIEAIIRDNPQLAGSGYALWGVSAALLVKHPLLAAGRASVEKIPGTTNVTLAPGCAIEGRVVLPSDAANVAASGTVRLQRVFPEPAPGERPGPFEFQVESTSLDDRGRYRFQSLPAGEYHLTAAVEGWVTRGREDVVARAGETTTAPDIQLTRGGQVRVRLVHSKTSEPMRFEKPTFGYINPQEQPRRAALFQFQGNYVNFSTDAATEITLPAGRYGFHAFVPTGAVGAGWIAALPDKLDEWPTHEVVDGETLELSIAMRVQEPPTQASGQWDLYGTVTPASDEAPEDDGPNDDPPTSDALQQDLVAPTPPTEEGDAAAGDSEADE